MGGGKFNGNRVLVSNSNATFFAIPAGRKLRAKLQHRVPREIRTVSRNNIPSIPRNLWPIVGWARRRGITLHFLYRNIMCVHYRRWKPVGSTSPVTKTWYSVVVQPSIYSEQKRGAWANTTNARYASDVDQTTDASLFTSPSS